jgi:hypothetical protein
MFLIVVWFQRTIPEGATTPSRSSGARSGNL